MARAEPLLRLANGGLVVMPRVAQICSNYINSSCLCIWDEGYRHFSILKTAFFGIFMPSAEVCRHSLHQSRLGNRTGIPTNRDSASRLTDGAACTAHHGAHPVLQGDEYDSHGARNDAHAQPCCCGVRCEQARLTARSILRVQ